MSSGFNLDETSAMAVIAWMMGPEFELTASWEWSNLYGIWNCTGLFFVRTNDTSWTSIFF